jgi:hypothetical protein
LHWYCEVCHYFRDEFSKPITDSAIMEEYEIEPYDPSQRAVISKTIKTFIIPTPNRKRCPKCLEYVLKSAKVCNCGHTFKAHQQRKRKK